jgi:HSP20 family protein
MFDLVPFGRNNRNWLSPFNAQMRQFDNVMNSLFSNPMRTDIVDNGDHYVLTAELPGFDKSDVKLNLQNNYLTVTAAHSEERQNQDEKAQYTCRERTYCNYRRSFDVSDIVTEEIKAEYKNGVLEVVLPKKDVTEKKDDGSIEIEIV